jgi:hypothetical protein
VGASRPVAADEGKKLSSAYLTFKVIKSYENTSGGSLAGPCDGTIVREPITKAIWRQTQPTEILDWLQALSVPWWIAGGWALDMYLGKSTRPHADIDVGIFRRDARNACTTLSDWQFYEAKEGFLTRLESYASPRKDVNSLWCRRLNDREWSFELMLDEGSGDAWSYRRDASICRSLEQFICRGADGIPYLAPEIQLLYKSKTIRPKDQTDFESVVDRLDQDARKWLRNSIASMEPNHAWLFEL